MGVELPKVPQELQVPQEPSIRPSSEERLTFDIGIKSKSTILGRVYKELDSSVGKLKNFFKKKFDNLTKDLEDAKKKDDATAINKIVTKFADSNKKTGETAEDVREQFDNLYGVNKDNNKTKTRIEIQGDSPYSRESPVSSRAPLKRQDTRLELEKGNADALESLIADLAKAKANEPEDAAWHVPDQTEPQTSENQGPEAQ